MTKEKQSLCGRAISFQTGRDVPNKDTLEAIEEVRRLKNAPNKKIYKSFDEILREVEKDSTRARI